MGRLVYEKGVQHLISAMPKILEGYHDAKLIVAGKGGMIDELKAQVRAVRNSYLSYWDFTQLDDAPFTEEEKAFYREYRQYLRYYTEQENWWLKNPDDYETWLIAHHPVTEEK